MIAIQQLGARYQGPNGRSHVALTAVSFRIEAGEIVGLLGESGSGKSTLGMALCGALKATEVTVQGNIHWEGDTHGASAGGAVLIPQTPSQTFSPFLRCGGQIEDVLRARGIHQHEARLQAQALLQEVGLQERRAWAAYPHELSGGELQRVAVARALALQPRLLVADEACSALDLLHGIRLRQTLQALQRARGLSILWITHHPRELIGFATRMLVLENGRIVDERGVDAHAASSAPPCTQRFLTAMPSGWSRPQAGADDPSPLALNCDAREMPGT